MHVHGSPLGWTVQAPAKLNLFFEILGKRGDGYHEIETLVYPINWFDTLYFREESSGQIKFGCHKVSGIWGPRGRGLGQVPSGTENLAVRAVELLRRRAGISAGGTLRLVKRIPSAAGLGGGSSDAAAALALANQAWRLGWPSARLAELGGELGSDVPAFFAHGPAICRGRGEQVQPVAAVGRLHLVVVRPPAGLATADVYAACRAAGPERPVRPLLEALIRGDLSATGRLLFNRLEGAAEKLSPWIQRLRSELARMDCPGHRMSGSGTCYFGLCWHARHARRVAGRLRARGVGIAVAVEGSR